MHLLPAALLFASAAGALEAQTAEPARTSGVTPGCSDCEKWNAPQAPFKLYGNSWYVGTHGLSAILITSPSGHVLIDGGLPESASRIAANIRTLGFRVEDVKLIVNSHDHFDHAGGIAALQRLSGAAVAASASSATVLRKGDSGPDDPQYGLTHAFPPVPTVRVIADGDTLRAGATRLVAHFTAGHTPGGTTWTWSSCEAKRCLEMVYADSQTPVSADDFHFTRSRTYPNAIKDFEHSFTVLETLRCDMLLTPHPDASGLWQHVASRAAGNANALIDTNACKQYAATARERLAARVAKERQ